MAYPVSKILVCFFIVVTQLSFGDTYEIDRNFREVTKEIVARSTVILFVNACIANDEKAAENIWDPKDLIRLNRNEYLGGLKGLMAQIKNSGEKHYVQGPMPSKSEDLLLFSISNDPTFRNRGRFIFVKYLDGIPVLLINNEMN